MDADENRVAIRIGDRHPGTEWNKHVTIPRHYDAIARFFEDRSQPERHVQCHGLLRHLLARDTASIKSAVAGIDHDGRARTIAAAGCAGGISRRKTDGGCGEEKEPEDSKVHGLGIAAGRSDSFGAGWAMAGGAAAT